MVEYENECVSCDLYCVNCGLKRVPHYYCDECGAEEKLYDFDGRELCGECVLETLDVVEGSE